MRKTFKNLMAIMLLVCLFSSSQVSAIDDIEQHVESINKTNNLYFTYKYAGDLSVVEGGPVANYLFSQQDKILRSYGQVAVSKVEWFGEYIRVTISSSGSDYYSQPLTMRGKVAAYRPNGVDLLSEDSFYAKGTGGGAPYVQKDIWVGNSDEIMLRLENVTGNTYGGEAFSVPVASKLVHR